MTDDSRARAGKRRQTPATLRTIACLFATGLPLLAGCPQSSSPIVRDRVVDREQAGNNFLNAAIRILDSLPEKIDLNLQPEEVVLDATTSRNRKNVMAVIVRDPRSESGPINVLRVVTNNGQFLRKSLGIRPGDRVRIYTNRDQYGRLEPMNLIIARLINDNTLQIAGSLQAELRQPARMEIWRNSNDRIEQIDELQQQYVRRRGPAIGWEPTPDDVALRQIIERLNQWVQKSSPTADWQVDPLVESLPEPLRIFSVENPEASPGTALATTSYAPYDARLLQEATWLRDVSTWVADKVPVQDDLSLVRALFDWTIRNVQLETRDSMSGAMFRPWQTLVLGRGTAEQRAWIFLLLARQAGYDVAMLAHQDPEQPQRWRPWLPAWFHQGKLYLFDTELGLPIPGPGGKGVATLRQAAEDESILTYLDVDDFPYRVRPGQVDQVVALVEGSAFALSKRAQMLQTRLTGQSALVLTARPTQFSRRLQEHPLVARAQLWDLPYRTSREQLDRHGPLRARIAQAMRLYAVVPKTWQAKVLYLTGKFAGKEGAMAAYRKSRPSQSIIDKLEENSPGGAESLRLSKEQAGLGLGLCAYESGNYKIAIDYLGTRTLETFPQGRWAHSARYNLARSYEAAGDITAAVRLYRQDVSPQVAGNRLRARMLQTGLLGESE